MDDTDRIAASRMAAHMRKHIGAGGSIHDFNLRRFYDPQTKTIIKCRVNKRGGLSMDIEFGIEALPPES